MITAKTNSSAIYFGDVEERAARGDDKNGESAIDNARIGDSRRVRYQTLQRLQIIHAEIAANRFPNSAMLADLLEINLRTVKRDIAFLRDDLNAPLRYDAKKRGYYYLDLGWSLPPVSLSEGELLAFFIAEQALKQTGHGTQAAQLRAALSKLSALLPTTVSFDIATLRENVSFESAPFAAADSNVLKLVAIAAREKRTIEFDYRSLHKPENSHRRADVLLLHNFAGDWFAVSFDHDRKELRDFHIGRMKNVTETNSYFEVPKNWDAGHYLKSGFSMMRGGKTVTVEIEFDAHQAQWIREREKFHPEERREEIANGNLKLSFEIGEQGLEAVARFCLQYAGSFRVISPPKLKEIVLEKLLKAVETHN